MMRGIDNERLGKILLNNQTRGQSETFISLVIRGVCKHPRPQVRVWGGDLEALNSNGLGFGE